jgi:hypothetical protein
LPVNDISNFRLLFLPNKIILFNAMRYLFILAFSILIQSANANETRFETLLTVNKEVALQSDIPFSWTTENIHTNNFNEAIQVHLTSVIEVLKHRSVNHLSLIQNNQRTQLLKCLENYVLQGNFPINDFLSFQNPVFIDHFDTHCAVGFLMQQSGSEHLARQIQSIQNFAYVRQISVNGVSEWANEHGFTLDELAWIQPGYPPNTIVSPLLGGVNGAVNDMFMYNGELIAAGNFSQADGQPANNIASYISGFAGFLWIETFGGTNGPVYALDTLNYQLIAAGEFSIAGTSSVNNIARLGDNGWEAMGSGIFGKVNDLEWHEGELYAAGDFQFIQGGPANADIAKWNGLEWMPLGWGTNGSIHALRSSPDGLLFAGDFTEAGNASMLNVGKMFGGVPESLGLGIDAAANDIELWNNKPVIAANLKHQGEVFGLMQFNAGNWEALPGISEMATNDSLGSMRCLMVTNNELYVGGDFSVMELMTFGENLAKWTSSDVYPTSVAVFDSTVYCLDNIQQSLIAGGEFTHHLGTEINHIAFLDNVLRVEELENETSDFSIFPNPCTGEFSIWNNGKAIHMELYSMDGKLINSFFAQENAKITLPESGIYLLKTESGKCFKVVSQN